MTHQAEPTLLNRRDLLSGGIRGLGGIALASLLASEGLLAAEPGTATNPLVPHTTHFPAKATNCIFFFMWGGPSHIDLFDPKPQLAKRDGQSIPEWVLKNAQFPFVKKETARLQGSPFKFRKFGKSGTEFCELLPHIGGCADDIARGAHAAFRLVQSSPGADSDEHRFHANGPAAAGIVAAVWPGKSVGKSAGIRSNEERPRAKWRLVELVERVFAIGISGRAIAQ